ncbi:MAG TPA: TolC family protein [Candidatus Acidoferrum sp.]|nr:TolC family protein [Candidatus Acidoferrum sp.]
MKPSGILRGLLICAVAAQAQTNKTQTLTLEQAIQMAIEHNLALKVQRYIPELDQFALGAVYGTAYEPAFNSTFKGGHSDNPGQIFNGIAAPNLDTEYQDYQFGIGGANGGNALTPWGLQYSLTSTMDRNTYQTFTTNGLPKPPFTQDTTTASINLQQPLLKNFWIDSSRATILIARKTIQYDEFGFYLAVMTNISSTEQAYYELNYAFENVRVQEDAVRLAEQLVSENRQKVRAGVLTDLDVAQSLSQLASSRAGLLAAQQLVSQDENNLKALITDKYREMYDVKLVPAEKLMAAPEMFDLEGSWQTALAKRPDLLQAKVAVDRLEVSRRFQKNQLFPELDLTGSYGRTGLNGTMGSSLGEIPDNKFPNYSYGAVLTVPLGNQAARNNYKAAKASKEQAQAAYQLVEQNILIQIQNTIEKARSDYEQTKATRDARDYADQALQAEERKLQVGTSTSFIVLQLQSNLTAARSAEIRALANYNEDLTQLAQFEGTILERHHLTVKIY